jgi:hypothetical protein
MLMELKNTNQNPGDLFRRWFHDDYFDLIVWLNPDGSAHGFQLCYDKTGDERSLTWRSSGTYSHNGIDDGEGRPFRHKSAPIAVPDGVFNASDVAKRFLKESEALPEDIRSLVLEAIRQYQQ